MKVTKQTPTKEITISGLKLSVPQPYGEGHTLTENEALALNQVLAENLRNNFATRIRKAKDACEKEGKAFEPDEKAMQADLNTYITEYEFGVRQTGTSTAHLDPVEKEVLAMARKAIRTAIQEKGIKIKDVPKETIEKLVEDYRKKNLETLHKHATVIVESREAVTASVGDDITL